MQKSQDPIESIINDLKNKSSVKQKTYRYLCVAFENLMKQGRSLVKEIKVRTKDIDEDITIEFFKLSNREFHIKVAGDLVIFVQHANVVTFEDQHSIVQSSYVHEDENRKYFGQIMIYNFMSESVKANRLKDPGYLLGRILLNYENHFFVEGEGQLNFMFSEVSPRVISKLDIDVVLKLAITTAAKSDLITPPFQKIKNITLFDKVESTQSLGGGRKIGFQMNAKGNIS